MNSLVLVGPIVLWLVLAIPLNCHNGITSPWAAAGHFHQASQTDPSVSDALAAMVNSGQSAPEYCQHHGPAAGAPVASGALDYTLDSNYTPLLEPSGSDLPIIGSAAPRGAVVSPPERPPSHPA